MTIGLLLSAAYLYRQTQLRQQCNKKLCGMARLCLQKQECLKLLMVDGVVTLVSSWRQLLLTHQVVESGLHTTCWRCTMCVIMLYASHSLCMV
jgi:hypothetical protein